MADFKVAGDFGFKTHSQDWYIAKWLLEGKTREETVRGLFPMVAEKRPFIYSANVGGGRRVKPRIEQYRLFIYNVARTMGKMKHQGWEYSAQESFAQRKRWESKERTYVRWRHEFIMDLVREGVIKDPDNPKPLNPPEPKPNPLPTPGSVKPVDPQGNPLYSQDDLQSMKKLLDDDGLLEQMDLSADDDIDGYWQEFDDSELEAVADWELRGEKLTRVRKNNKKGKYEDQFNGLIAVKVEEPEPEPEPPKTRATEIKRFYDEMLRARDFVVTRELSGEFLDFISTRAIKDGCKAIAHGISVEEVFEAVTKTWPADSKNELKNWTKLWKQKPWPINVQQYKSELEGAHACLGYVEVLAKARIPILLVGPSGSGKSFMMRDLADSLDMDYGETPLTAGATPSWLVGAETITGYKTRPFVEIYEKGGVYCFEEVDAADPNMLLLVNNAIANDSFFNPVTGQELVKHHDFIVGATANTWGIGSNRQYTGRERLDAATLDRFRVGRVEVQYDEIVEKAIVKEWQGKAEKMERPHKAKKKKVKVNA